MPPYRASIIIAARFCRRLLVTVHTESYLHRYSMVSELFPASITLYYNLKAVFTPHLMYLKRD